MNKMAKKVVIYSMVGLFQLGLGTSVIEAAPEVPWQQQQQDNNDKHQQGNDKQHQQHPDNDKPWQEPDGSK
ncbi:hypothetical protein [Sporomusa sp. KB1]|jgi:hypothetical protein|uniref:hypothetical protein n=1 Tax=Sporomusa sp. KB1 TaxID=943346 RepID=UPI0011A76C00|nr:hypothetical protein [Sporomusa sp. KB1]TWH44968.1 hypothetical protein Salpa_0847 [Sporomusa sp. KB1]